MRPVFCVSSPGYAEIRSPRPCAPGPRDTAGSERGKSRRRATKQAAAKSLFRGACGNLTCRGCYPRGRISGQPHGSVIVTMAGVGAMETPIDEVIDMIAMRYRLMPATGAVNMVRPAGFGRAPVGVRGVYRELMLVHVIAVDMMHVAVMEIIHMPVVPHRCVAAVGTVLVRMIGMMRLGTGSHDFSFLSCVTRSSGKSEISVVRETTRIRHCSQSRGPAPSPAPHHRASAARPCVSGTSAS